MSKSELSGGIAYFKAFRDARLDSIGEAMREYRVSGNSGYQRFAGSDTVVQTLQDIHGNFEDVFADFSVPAGFVTPSSRLETITRFRDMLVKRQGEFERIAQSLIAAGEKRDGPDWSSHDHLPTPFVVASAILDEVIEALQHTLQMEYPASDAGLSASRTASEVIEAIFLSFPRFARRLAKRHDDRETLVIKDEYDVQDALHALLLTQFADVRDEEYTPSNAGASARMDFLLVAEEVVIEVKMMRSTMSAKTLSAELATDKQRYRAHPKAKLTYFFVYDPQYLLKNPVGFMSDLSETIGPVEFRTIIVPVD